MFTAANKEEIRFEKLCFLMKLLKGQGHLTLNKPVASRIFIATHTVAIVFCTDFGGWGESTLQLLVKFLQYPCHRTTYECMIYFSTKHKSPSSNENFHSKESGVNSL